MPIYEYRCSRCQNLQEAFLRSLNHEEPTKCDHCETYSLERVLGKTSAHFRGRGFHNTDYHKHGAK